MLKITRDELPVEQGVYGDAFSVPFILSWQWIVYSQLFVEMLSENGAILQDYKSERNVTKKPK